jgi:hypothetical protein
MLLSTGTGAWPLYSTVGVRQWNLCTLKHGCEDALGVDTQNSVLLYHSYIMSVFTVFSSLTCCCNRRLIVVRIGWNWSISKSSEQN